MYMYMYLYRYMMPGSMAQIWGWGGDVSVEELVLHEAFWAEAHPDEERVALDITEQVLTALETLHGAGHIHADLHMDNMMVHTSQRGLKVVNLIDLGCCTPRGVRCARWATKPAGHTQHPLELWCDSMECGNVTLPWGDTRAHG